MTIINPIKCAIIMLSLPIASGCFSPYRVAVRTDPHAVVDIHLNRKHQGRVVNTTYLGRTTTLGAAIVSFNMPLGQGFQLLAHQPPASRLTTPIPSVSQEGACPVLAQTYSKRFNWKRFVLAPAILAASAPVIDWDIAWSRPPIGGAIMAGASLIPALLPSSYGGTITFDTSAFTKWPSPKHRPKQAEQHITPQPFPTRLPPLRKPPQDTPPTPVLKTPRAKHPSPKTVREQFKQLKELLDQGVITEHEYHQARGKILDKL